MGFFGNKNALFYLSLCKGLLNSVEDIRYNMERKAMEFMSTLVLIMRIKLNHAIKLQIRFTLLIQLLSAELTHLRLVWPFKIPLPHQWSTDDLVVLLNNLDLSVSNRKVARYSLCGMLSVFEHDLCDLRWDHIVIRVDDVVRLERFG